MSETMYVYITSALYNIFKRLNQFSHANRNTNEKSSHLYSELFINIVTDTLKQNVYVNAVLLAEN